MTISEVCNVSIFVPVLCLTAQLKPKVLGKTQHLRDCLRGLSLPWRRTATKLFLMGVVSTSNLNGFHCLSFCPRAKNFHDLRFYCHKKDEMSLNWVYYYAFQTEIEMLVGLFSYVLPCTTQRLG